MSCTLLCAADLHIGRRPARLPVPWGGGRITAARAWAGLVECALQHQVDAVLLAGDVVDQDNRFFEAYGPVGHGVRRLKEAGIAVVAVAGNHDHHTLHQVAAEVGDGHLVVLGRGGQWERWTLRDGGGAARLHVDGWSFPTAHYGADPTASHDLAPPDDGAPVVGLLHCDVDSSDPRYAPLPAAALARVPVAAWVLGHVHGPSLRQEPGRAPVLYAGSLLALSPMEEGPRGAWLVDLAPGRAPSFRQIPLSAVRYETAVIPVDDVTDPDGLRATVAAALVRRLDEVVAEGAGPLEVVSCRVRLTGRTPLHSRLDRLLADLGDLDLAERQGVRLVVERTVAETRPALDLHDLARGADATGLLARLLLELDTRDGPVPRDGAAREPDAAATDAAATDDAATDDAATDDAATAAAADLAPTDVVADALARAAAAAARIRARSYYAGLPLSVDADPDAGMEAGPGGGAGADAALGAVVRHQASRLLDELVRQKEAV